MFLKRLETVGFKSFAERINIDFVPGVTAVVGPNGSGKSNVIDAIRWVLGEQSAKSLRGQKMEDIIFQGSDTRKPLNFAEVTLILNNETRKLPIDYNEVSITRRVYRSGDSDFLINKQACRLKDIVDLFMDTGLGRESFSIISQGKIDEILSSKAEERRAIFEEAAGVLKYKQRKSKAEFKLEETNDNLSRVEDIIHEINQQAEPLKEQASIAKEYKEKRAALKNVEIALLITEIEALNTEWRALLQTIEDEKLLEINEKTRINKNEAKITQKQEELEKLDQQINEMQEALLKATELLEQFEGRRNVYYERVKHLQENKLKLTKDTETVQARKGEMTELLRVEKLTLTELNDNIAEINREISHVENKLLHGHDQLVEVIEDLKSDYIEYLNEQAVLQNEQRSIQNQLEQMEKSHGNEQRENQTSITDLDNLREEKKQLEIQILAETEQIGQVSTELEECKESLLTERKAYEEMQRNLYEGNEQIAKLASRKEMLEDMKESFQGFFFGVREVLKASENNVLSDIDGAVLDLMDVPNKYVTAIDTILGAQVQHIVVPNDEVARKTINWLKRENKGRATFLPLASIERRVIPGAVLEQVQEHKGFIGVAADLVQAESRYKKVLEHLMGNVIVTTDLQSANEIAGQVNRRYRVVTLDGDIVFPGGSMSGGAKRKTNQSLFTRDKELVNLREKLINYQERAALYTEKVNEKRKYISDLEIKIDLLTNKTNELKNNLQTIEALYQKAEINVANMEGDLASYHLHMNQFEENKAALQAQSETIAADLLKVQLTIKETDKAIDEKTAEEQDLIENERSVQIDLHELEIRAAEYEERKKSQSEKIESLSRQVTELELESDQLAIEMKELIKLEQLGETEATLEEKVNENRVNRDKLREDIAALQAIRQENVQEIADDEREVREQHKIHAKFVQEMQQNEVKANRLDVSLENRLTHLQTEYVMTYERASEMYDKVEDVPSAQKNVSNMKQAIKSLGSVNIGAIEEYDRIMERYHFLTDQKQDLLDAQATLYAAINEMDKEMIERFSDVFTQVQTAFTEVFSRLFEGGNAALVLTEPDNLLETGIEIIAQPPGKKMKSLGLLSGGERALTAIALLFAILKVRPVPFCILDEVDAALDEANVKRFSNYLKVYSEGTQFIVITHRNGTMEEADVLYGVTMQESGVSRLVSVRLEEMNEFAELT